MKNFAIATFLGLALLTTSSAEAFLIEGKVEFFHPNSHILRKILGNWMPTYQIEVSGPVYDPLYFWGSAGYLSKEGHSLGGHQKTELRLIPLTLGLQYVHCFNQRFEAYIGLGARYFFARVKNDSDFVHKKDSKGGLGGSFRAGGLIYFTEQIVLDLCIDYSLKTLSFSGSSETIKRHDLNLSGLNLGVGLGYAF